MSDFAGKTAVVTGGASGIGAAIALAFLDAGARVAVADLRAECADAELRGRFARFGDRCRFLAGDVGDVAQAERLIAQAREFGGSLDILVNNAGINRDAVIWKMTEAEWDDVLRVDLKGCFAMARAAAPLLRAARSGSIVNIASINGLRGKFGQCNYAAAKAGMIGLTKSLARELGPSGVTVNAVAPGFIETPMTAKLPAEIREAAVREIALGRAGAPEDVAAAVLFLAGPGARHITGEVLKVDGGQYI